MHAIGRLMGGKRLSLFLVFALVLVGLVTIGPPTSVAAGPTIVAQNFSFVGPNGNGDVTIPVGTMVTWTNGGGLHTTTSDAATPLWDAPLGAGQQFLYTFTQAGTYGYHCTFHGAAGTGMHGTITVVAMPTTPSGLHVTSATSNSVTYGWTPSDTVSNIAVTDGTTATPLAPNTATFTTSGLPLGGYSCLAVAAYNIAGASAYSGWVCGQVRPLTPTNPHVTGATTSTVSFGWTNNDALSYIALSNGSTGFGLAPGTTTYTQTGVFAGYYACVTVAEYNATYTSAFSPYACGFALPAAPSAVHTTGHTSTSVSFAWTNQDPYSGIALTNDGVHLLNEGINATTYTQTGMAPNQYACIETVAYNSSGASSYTSWVCGQAGP